MITACRPPVVWYQRVVTGRLDARGSMTHKQFDVAVVGSGFGGATLASQLSRAGLHVGIVERGPWPHRDDDDWSAKRVLIERRYQSPSPIEVIQYGASRPSEQLQDAAVGGLSAFYGAAALRLRETDFDTWPLRYADLEPHYAAAEALLEVHGSAGKDPFEPPRSTQYPFDAVPLTAPARRIFEAAQTLGYRPFVMPLAINRHNVERPKCIECFTCDGFPCKICAKNDMVTTALAKADTSRLEVLSSTVGRRLQREGSRITELECLDAQTGQALRVAAKLFVVSCGAIHTPALLLRSGLAELDQSKMLGRHLMRHCNAIVGCVFPFRVNPQGINHKQVCVSHFYDDLRATLGRSVGVIQDMCMPPADAVRHLAPPGVKWAAYSLAARIQSLICVAEDEPQQRNCVRLSRREDGLGMPVVEVDHDYTAADLRRRDYLVRQAKRLLRRAGGWICKTRRIDSFSHAVGSVRFGTDPRHACLDQDCRFFGLDNLFVVDGSFMPSSGGVNPSLTITANAVRVAELVLERLGSSGRS